MKIRITIEYDPDWSDECDKEEALSKERSDWECGHVDINDVLNTEGSYKFEILP